MKKIGDFFKRIQNIHARELYSRSIVAGALEKHIGIRVPIENISFDAGSAVIKGISQVARSQIFVKKSVLLKEIESGQPNRPVTDIR